jgi:hypothetical protein
MAKIERYDGHGERERTWRGLRLERDDPERRN